MTVEQNGFDVFSNILDAADIATLIDAMERSDVARSTRGDATYGARNILDVPEVADIANSTKVLSPVADLIGPDARPVRGIFFDKTQGANWPVAWHQDLTLALAAKHEVDGWDNWSTKAGVAHVQPPYQILVHMITLRLHLDDCDADNGPLKVLPGTHRLGRIAAPKIQELRGAIPVQVCVAEKGSALAMKPLLLHASSAAASPRRRRVVHIEFAPKHLLPAPLRWLPLQHKA